MPPNCELVPQASALRLAIQRALTTANLKYSLFAIICYVTLYLRKFFILLRRTCLATVTMLVVDPSKPWHFG